MQEDVACRCLAAAKWRWSYIAVLAFLHSEMVGDVYVEVPPLWAELLGLLADQVKGKVAKLLRGLYGLRQAPWLWQQKFKFTGASGAI